ncbi:MAG: Xaa-Pro aminopeptidase [Candidatus Onthovivens sp.]|nr:Xaa-Pro aminopeptidase [Candidatus Onthovivens sp.]
MITVREFAKRREKLYAQLDDNSITILFSGIAKKSSADADYPFVVNKNFYYLTNIKQEDSALLITKNGGLVKEYLFISEYDEVKEKRTGKRLTPAEARAYSGINNVLFINNIDAHLSMLFEGKGDFENYTKVYMDLEAENKIRPQTSTIDFKNSLSLNYDYLEFEDIYEKIIRMRMVKSADEIEEFKEAISKTNIGLQNIMRHIKPDLYEYQLSSLFFYTIQDYDYSDLSFPTICASGVNATCLHYPTPVSKIQKNDLVLFDLGCQNNMYCADITRTYPASGKFSALQKTIYNIVLKANKLVIDSIKPGITIAELNEITINCLAEGCLKAKLIKNPSEISKYYFHNISHHIGLDTHDPSLRHLPLEAGNIISDEPGLYFKELGIGVRIEDDILVTEDGSYNLSNQILKEPDDIEAAIAFSRSQKHEI